MKKFYMALLVIVLIAATLSACRSNTTETMMPSTLSNDELGTRAVKTAYVNFTEAAPVQASDTPFKKAPILTRTGTVGINYAF